MFEQFGKYGAWLNPAHGDAARINYAPELEDLGYTTIWVGIGAGPMGEMALLEKTTLSKRPLLRVISVRCHYSLPRKSIIVIPFIGSGTLARLREVPCDHGRRGRHLERQGRDRPAEGPGRVRGRSPSCCDEAASGTPWADRVAGHDIDYTGSWELPLVGDLVAPDAVLVRPDGYVAWVANGSAAGLADALDKCFT